MRNKLLVPLKNGYNSSSVAGLWTRGSLDPSIHSTDCWFADFFSQSTVETTSSIAVFSIPQPSVLSGVQFFFGFFGCSSFSSLLSETHDLEDWRSNGAVSSSGGIEAYGENISIWKISFLGDVCTIEETFFVLLFSEIAVLVDLSYPWGVARFRRFCG